MSAKETAFRLAALTALKDLIDSEVQSIRKNEMGPALLFHYTETGGDRITVTLPGSKTKLATVTLDVKEDEPEDTISIDAQRFVEWVIDNAPDEVLPVVRSTYAKVVADRLVIADDGVTVFDSRTGDVADYATVVPGGPVPDPTGKFTLRFEGGTGGVGRETFAEAWRSGELTAVSDVLAIGPGGSG